MPNPQNYKNPLVIYTAQDVKILGTVLFVLGFFFADTVLMESYPAQINAYNVEKIED